MDCLNNIIGIRGCDAPATEASGPGVEPVVEALPILYINQLPGISFENIEALADDEQETFLGLWVDVVLRTMKKFETLVKAQLNKCYKLTDKTVVECLICENKELFYVPLWYLHGTEIMIERTSTDTMSRYTTIDLDKAEKLKEEYYIEFQSSLNDAVQSMNPADSDCVTGCLECNDSVRWVMQTP
ncbi:MAG: hypothetical protein JWO92_1106 [Chitinophagaceae bacterium]|nr:hypothetical protein [Chitinophagaceae bacterium]